MSHPEDAAILAYTLGQLQGAAENDVGKHLVACEECQGRQREISSDAFAKTVSGSGVSTQPEGARATDTRQPELRAGATLGRYVLLGKLGAGGMGEVFAAYDPQLDRKVAIKLLRGGALSAEEGKARILREAQAMARLQHPNVIAVHDVGLFNARVFIAMEYVEGETLAAWLRGSHRWEEVIHLFMQAGAGLAAAHRAGLVHRDFKPDNVLLGADARPRVLDFGLARQATATPAPAVPGKEAADSAPNVPLNAQLTLEGMVMGTPGYMAPEQISGPTTDARSDQFSFCVALWEGLYGTRPFSGATLLQHAQAIASGSLVAPPLETQVPGWVNEVLRRGLSANPADRWADMEALLRALRPRAKGKVRRALLATALMVFSAFGIGYGVWTRQRLQICSGTERQLTGRWDATRKAKLHAGFVGTGLSYAEQAWTNTERSLDTWAAEWTLASREVCEASRLRQMDSPEATELKTACLQERLQRLEALVALFETPDRDVVNNAPTAARTLEPANSCTATAGLRRQVAADEKELAADLTLRSKLAEARALFAAGKYPSGAERLKLGLAPTAPAATQAEAYLWLARLELKRGELGAARQANLQAAEQALKSGEASLAARALSRLYANEGFDEGEADADAWNRLAVAAAARVPDDWGVQVELSQNSGLVDLRRKHYEAAKADYERVLSLQSQHLGREHPEIASTLNNLGVVLTHLDPEAAVSRYEESLRLHEKLEGAEHPNVATASQNLAIALRHLGRLSEARPAFERALQVRRAALGFKHPESLRNAQLLAKLLIQLGDLDPARALLDEVKAARAPDSIEMLSVLELETELLLTGEFWPEALKSAGHHLDLAKMLGRAGEKDLSLALLEQTIAWTELGAWVEASKAAAEVQRRQSAGAPTDAAMLAECLGRLELAQGRAPAALPLLERSISLRGKGGAGALKATLLLARALLAVGRTAEAIPVASSAEQQLMQMGVQPLVVDAQMLRAQAIFLAHPEERAGATELLVSLLPQLPDNKRQTVTSWLRKQGGGSTRRRSVGAITDYFAAAATAEARSPGFRAMAVPGSLTGAPTWATKVPLTSPTL